MFNHPDIIYEADKHLLFGAFKYVYSTHCYKH